MPITFIPANLNIEDYQNWDIKLHHSQHQNLKSQEK